MNERGFRGKLRTALRAIAGALVVTASACTTDLGDATPDIPAFADSHDRCLLVPPPNVEENGPFSLSLPEGSELVFAAASVDANGAPPFLQSSAAVADGSRDPCAPVYVRGADGSPTTILALSDEERAADMARADGRQTVLWPIAGFATSSGGVLFYQKVLFNRPKTCSSAT